VCAARARPGPSVTMGKNRGRCKGPLVVQMESRARGRPTISLEIDRSRNEITRESRVADVTTFAPSDNVHPLASWMLRAVCETHVRARETIRSVSAAVSSARQTLAMGILPRLRLDYDSNYFFPSSSLNGSIAAIEY